MGTGTAVALGVAGLALACAARCGAQEVSPTPRGDRLLGIDVGAAEDQDYGKAFGHALSAGAQVVGLSLPWDDIEKAPGKYENPFPAIANSYYPTRNVLVALMVGPIDTNRRRMPADLADRPFDDPLVLRRYNAMIDWVFSQMPDLKLACLSIGNEIDIYLGADAARWEQYRAFFAATVAHVKAIRPDLPVGAKATLPGLTGPAKSELLALNAGADVVMATYYPLNGDFTVKDPSVVPGDFDKLAATYPGRTIYFLEAGYPSGTGLGSSEERQAAFVRQVMSAWDAHADQVKLVMFTWLTDASPKAVEGFKDYYGLTDRRFLEYLATLGLRTYPGSGEDKKAFRTLVEEARARGWAR